MWYNLNTPDTVFSPGLLFYKDRIEGNIRRMINIAGSADRLIPHVKTHKTTEIVKMQLNLGISKFKCATIAEAEMLADAGAKWVLLAYQMVGPNIDRLLALREKFPDVLFSSLLDNEDSATRLDAASKNAGIVSTIFIDVNNGMNRTGHATDGSLLALYRSISAFTNLTLLGAHVYDGHIREPEFAERKAETDTAFDTVLPLIERMTQDLGNKPMVIAGGSPSFTVHTLRDDVFLSPGTNVLWDYGYGDRFDDQPFLHAALIITRVISKPSPGIVTIDLGHKAVAAENPIGSRFRILNLKSYELLSQSEEHGVLQLSPDQWENTKIGDVLYALPYHICPSVALHAFAYVVEDGHVQTEWQIKARTRKITV